MSHDPADPAAVLHGEPTNAEDFRRNGISRTWERYAGRLTWGRGQCLAVLDDGCDLTVPQWQEPLPWGQPKVVAGYDSIDLRDDPTPVPPGYHGTGVGFPSSLNYQGQLGVAPNNTVAHVRCVTIVHLPQDESETLARGLQWVIDNREAHNITTVNLSPLDDQPHAGPVDTVADAKFRALRGLGVWVSAPCGNNNHTTGISWPACQPDCFGIGATRADTDEVCLDRFSNTDILVAAAATSSSNAYIVGSSMILREAIARGGYDWQVRGPTLPDAMMAIFLETGDGVHDPATGLDFKRLNLLAAVDHVFADAD